MKRMMITLAIGMALMVGSALPVSQAGAEEISSLRGNLALEKEKSPPPVYKLKLDQEKFARNFKSQPPLIPHKVAKYKVNLKVNRCLKCHDKDNYKEEEAPMAGKSHYMGADGKEMDKIHMSRYFCSQCHVPQADAKPLVANTFMGTK